MIDLSSEATRLATRYPEGRSRSALIPLLHRVQQDQGYVTTEAMAEIARVLGLTTAEVSSVATFYTMFHMKPKGRHVVSVCHNLACTLAGAERVIEGLEAHLGVKCGQTTKDGEFTLERAECLAACDLAPMMQIDYDQMSGPLDAASAVSKIEEVRGQPASGGISEVLASTAASLHEPTEVGEREEFGPYVSSGQAPEPVPPMSAGRELPGPEPTPPLSDAEQADEVAAQEVDQEDSEPAVHMAGPGGTKPDDEDFVREDDESKDPYSKAPGVLTPADEEKIAVPGPVESADVEPDSDTQGKDPDAAVPADEVAPVDYSKLRGTRKSQVASERLHAVPPLPEGIGPGPADPKDLGAPDPKTGPVRRPRGAE